MKIKQYAAALAIGVAATTTMSVATIATTTTSASAAFDGCDLGVKLDELKAWDSEGRYNIIVWKDSAYGSADLKGVVEQGTTKEKTCEFISNQDDYHWAIFEEGTFTRTGDGGYRNWAFHGVFERPDDTTVHFSKRF